MENRLSSKANGRHREMLAGYLLILPVVLVIIVLVFYPMVSAIMTSFTSKRIGVAESQFVGLKNYLDVLKNPTFLRSFGNSVFWTVASLTMQFLLGLFCALLLNRSFKGRFLLRGLFIVPWVTPPVVAAIMYRWLLNGLFGYANQVLITLGIISEPLGWFSDPKLVMPTLIFINVWRGVPFMMITLLAGLQTIPVELIEAAKIDGAGALRRFFSITLPFLRHVISIALLIYTLWNFNNFDMIYLMTRGGPGTLSFTLPIMIYSAAFEEFQYGRAAAISTLMFLFLIVASMFFLRFMGKEADNE